MVLLSMDQGSLAAQPAGRLSFCFVNEVSHAKIVLINMQHNFGEGSHCLICADMQAVLKCKSVQSHNNTACREELKNTQAAF